MPSCCIKSCQNRGNIPGITYHKIPFRMKEAWYRKLNAHVTGGMKDFSVHMVCSDHFQRGDLRRNGLRVLLKNGAVPTLYLDKPKESLNSMNKPTNKPKTSVDINNHFNGQKKVYPEMPLAQEQKNKKKSNLEKDESSWYSVNGIRIIDINTILGSGTT